MILSGTDLSVLLEPDSDSGERIVSSMQERVLGHTSGLPACLHRGTLFREGEVTQPPPPTSLIVFLSRKARRKHKEQSRKLNRVESVRQNIANPDTRVVQTNLVFVSGLPLRLADEDLLKRPDYFGKFGKIHRVIIKQGTATSYLASRQQVRSHLDILLN